MGQSEERSAKNTIFKIVYVENVVIDELNNVTRDNWIVYVKRIEKLQEENFANKVGHQNISEPIIVNLQDC